MAKKRAWKKKTANKTLSLTIVFILFLLLLLTLTQIDSIKTFFSQAQTAGASYRGICNMTVSGTYEGEIGIYGFADIRRCDSSVKTVTLESWVKVDNRPARGVEIDSCSSGAGCRASTFSHILPLSGKHTYCTYGRVKWILRNGHTGTSGPIRSDKCLTVSE